MIVTRPLVRQQPARAFRGCGATQWGMNRGATRYPEDAALRLASSMTQTPPSSGTGGDWPGGPPSAGGSPHGPGSPGSQPSQSDSFFAAIRRFGIWRTDDRWMGGVCAGIGHRYGIDPIIVRALVVVTAIVGGLGLVFYGAAWALLPEARDNRIHAEEALLGRFDGALAGAGILLLLGLGNIPFWWSTSMGWAGGWLIVILIVLGAFALANRGGNRPTPQQQTPPQQTAHSTAQQPYDPTGPDQPSAAPTPAEETTTMPQPATHHGDELAGTDAGQAGSSQPAYAQQPPDSSQPAYAQQPRAEEPYGYGGYGPTPPPAYSGQPSGGAPPGGPPPGGPPPRPPRPLPPAPGASMVGLVIGLVFIAAAVILLGRREGIIEGNAAVLIGGSTLVLLGAGVLISGIRGRRQGSLGMLGFFTALIVIPLALVVATIPSLSQITGTDGTWIGNSNFEPSSTSEAEVGHTVGVGDLTADLRELKLSADDDITVPVEAGVGELLLIVPSEWDVTVDAHVNVGEVSGDGSTWQTLDRSTSWVTDHNNNLAGGTNVQLRVRNENDGPSAHIDAHVGIGDIIIREES